VDASDFAPMVSSVKVARSCAISSCIASILALRFSSALTSRWCASIFSSFSRTVDAALYRSQRHAFFVMEADDVVVVAELERGHEVLRHWAKIG
jgi:hypothetical protein